MCSEQVVDFVISDDGTPELTFGSHGRTRPLTTDGAKEEEVRTAKPTGEVVVDLGIAHVGTVPQTARLVCLASAHGVFFTLGKESVYGVLGELSHDGPMRITLSPHRPIPNHRVGPILSFAVVSEHGL